MTFRLLGREFRLTQVEASGQGSFSRGTRGVKQQQISQPAQQPQPDQGLFAGGSEQGVTFRLLGREFRLTQVGAVGQSLAPPGTSSLLIRNQESAGLRLSGQKSEL